MTRADKALAATLAAVTLAGGVGPAALADEATPSTPSNGSTQQTDATTLDKAIADAQAIDLNARNYTDETKTTFNAKLKTARDVKAKTDATQDEVTLAANDLNAAVKALTTVERERLAKAKADAAKLNKSDYTADSYKPLADLLAQADPADDKAGDAQAASRATDIENAIGSLVAQSWQDLSDSIDKAIAEDDRGLDYDSQKAYGVFHSALTGAKDALGEKADVSKDTAARRDNARKTLDSELANIQGTSKEQAAFEQALENAKKKDDATKYNNTDTLHGTIQQAEALDKNTADKNTFDNLTAQLNEKAKEPVIKSWTIAGKTFATGEDGTVSGEVTAKLPDKNKDGGYTITGSDGTETTLKDVEQSGFIQDGTTLGVGHISHTLTGTTEKGKTITITVDVPDGSETTATFDGNDTQLRFTRDDHTGAWTATLDKDPGLGSKPDKDGNVEDVTAWAHDVAMSDGTKLTLNPGVLESTAKDGKTIWTRTGTYYTGVTKDGTTVRVDIPTASRTYDSTVKLSVTAIDPTNPAHARAVLTQSGPVSDLKGSYTTVQQTRERIGDAYKASLTGSADAVDADSVAVSNGVGANGRRTFHITYRAYVLDGTSLKAKDRTVDVDVPFAAAKHETANPEARLDGFNVTGGASLDPTFDPDTLDYTIHLKADQHVTVTPITSNGVKAVAGDVAQTAFTTIQSWTVTAPNGKSRTYTVTAVREHTEKTADEKFTPLDPQGTLSKDPNPSVTNTQLKSWGYTLDGKYTAVDSDTFQIPQGGALAYEYYDGQAVNVTGTRSHGMTWDYDVSVLAADHETYGSTTLHVTYITDETNAAYLTGVKVDGRTVDGFDQSKHEYSVKVADPTQYVVTPQFDKMTGMSVSTHKTDTRAVITVTSADGLTKSVYTLNVSKSPVLAALASTGVAAGIGAAVAGLCVAVAIALGLVARRRGRTGREGEPSDMDGKAE
jgi:hypothetical protein